MQSNDVAIVGPYICHNFGDDLIGAVLAKHLESAYGLRSSIPGMSLDNADWLNCEFSDSVLKSVLHAKAIVAGGGGILGDSGRAAETAYLWRCVKAAILGKLLQKPVLITGVGAGPLRLEMSQRLCRVLCNLASRVGVRDQESYDFLLNAIRVPSEKVFVGADVALLWPRLLPVHVVSNGMVGVQCDAHGFASDGAARNVAYLYQRLGEWCSARHTESILVSNGRYDTSLYKHLHRLVPSLRYSKLPDFLPHLAGLKSIVTTHLHLSIAAYAARVPCFSVYVRDKTARFYRQIGRPERSIDVETATREEIDLILRSAETAEWTDADEKCRERLCSEAAVLLELLEPIGVSSSMRV